MTDLTGGTGSPVWNMSRTHYNNPVVDKLLEDAAVENDPVKRVKLFKDFQDTVARDVPDLNLFQPEFITIANQRVHEHSVTADGVEGNLAEAWVEPAAK